MHSGSATRNTTTEASRSRGSAALKCVMFILFSFFRPFLWPLFYAGVGAPPESRAAGNRRRCGKASKRFQRQPTPGHGAAGSGPWWVASAIFRCCEKGSVAAFRGSAWNRRAAGQRQEGIAFGIVGGDFAGFDVVDPAVDIQLASRQARSYRWVSAQVVKLGDDVLAGQDLHALVLGAALAVVLDHGAGHFGVAQPGLDRRHLLQRLRVEYRTHRTAIGVTADDDVVHAQGHDRVLDRRRDAAVHLPVGRNHVAHVAGHEQVAGRTLGNQFGNDPRVGAGNEHGTRLLRRGQFLEQLFLFREDFVMETQKAINDMFQSAIGSLGFRGSRAGRRGFLVRHDASSLTGS
ncbi:hypothetical protein COLO4_01457 [Corchorus olitorius]|uniref:Uncharacterized protein n=1 Tax=Corchorus olitorius TaxID=93759 RepID=A0A1R3L2F2_9ROSI|nr:hypothetical protein COLO4_01457 [Corchorus olitorius]